MQKSKHFIFILFILINFYFYYVSILIGEKLCWSAGVREKVSHSCPLDKHDIKFDGPKPKTYRPKSFARFISQMEVVKTNKVSAVWQS